MDVDGALGAWEAPSTGTARAVTEISRGAGMQEGRRTGDVDGDLRKPLKRPRTRSRGKNEEAKCPRRQG